jgi:hypothetical protein
MGKTNPFFGTGSQDSEAPRLPPFGGFIKGASDVTQDDSRDVSTLFLLDD